MRAEAQQYIDRIDAALALLRQSLDWEQALRRLDELDARVQDPTLWDDPKQAQAITQEQKRLETAINTVREIESEMGDAVEFVDELPHTATGKILKTKLREDFKDYSLPV